MTSLFLSLVALLFSCKNTPPPDYAKLGDGLYAEIETNKGLILVQLEYKKTPVTVANFVTLAEGKNDMVEAKYKGKPFFNGLKWHRVIKDFMIQGGDPAGNGSGGPGYKFKDEITDLKHDKGGILSMANAGAGTNGSQFFITHKATPHLDGLHTVFGHTVQGLDVVNNIEQNDDIKTVKIVRVGKEAKRFDAPKVFKEYYEKADAEAKIKTQALAKAKADKLAFFADAKATGIKTASGLVYKMLKQGPGVKATDGTEVMIEYSGYLENDAFLFDSSIAQVAKDMGNYIPQKDAAGYYKPIPFTIGTKSGMIPGFIEGLEKMSPGDKAIIFIPAHLGYGERGMPQGKIPGNANLIFELEMK